MTHNIINFEVYIIIEILKYKGSKPKDQSYSISGCVREGFINLCCSKIQWFQGNSVYKLLIVPINMPLGLSYYLQNESEINLLNYFLGCFVKLKSFLLFLEVNHCRWHLKKVNLNWGKGIKSYKSVNYVQFLR